MSDYVESAWESKGERTTTAYGANNSGFNEMGHRLPPKPVYNLHGTHVPNRPPVPLQDIAAMVTEYHRVNGCLPKHLLVHGPKQSDTYRGFRVPLLGYCGLDISYNAERTHVA